MEKTDGKAIADFQSDSYLTSKQTNTFSEINGEIVGVVIQDEKETLLIRKGRLYHKRLPYDEGFLATERAVFVEKELLNQYWIKLVERPYIVQTVNFDFSRSLIKEFFNV